MTDNNFLIIAYINDARNQGSQISHILLSKIGILDGYGQRFALVLGAQEVKEEFSDVPGEKDFVVKVIVRGQVVLVNDCNQNKKLAHL